MIANDWSVLLSKDCLSANEILLLAKLNYQKPCFLGDSELAEFFGGVKKETVQAWLRKLERFGIISRHWDGVVREIVINNDNLERLIDERRQLHKAIQ